MKVVLIKRRHQMRSLTKCLCLCHCHFFWSGHVSSSLKSNVSKVKSLQGRSFKVLVVFFSSQQCGGVSQDKVTYWAVWGQLKRHCIVSHRKVPAPASLNSSDPTMQDLPHVPAREDNLANFLDSTECKSSLQCEISVGDSRSGSRWKYLRALFIECRLSIYSAQWPKNKAFPELKCKSRTRSTLRYHLQNIRRVLETF